MTAWRRLVLITLVLVLAPSARAAEPPVVIILSWDGVRWDYPERVETRGLARMQREGVRAARLTPVFPSLTFPNHVALATGAPVDRHGIIANRFTDRSGATYSYSPEASWILAEPLWIAAERQGVRAATFFWVGSETDWRGRRASFRRAPFDEAVPETEKVRQILAWLDLPRPERPGLIMAWWHGCDSQGHRFGPDAPEVGAQLRAQDEALVTLLEGLDRRRAWDHVTLLVVSDHGMAGAWRQIDVAAPLEAAAIPARVEVSGALAEVYLDEASRAPAARDALSASGLVKVYTRAERPPGLRSLVPGRSGDLLVMAEPPDLLVSGTGRAGRVDRARPVGVHGYRPELPDMGAIFFALGRGVPTGKRLGPVRAIDVAPTAAALLGIGPPAQSEGQMILAVPPSSPR
jgi:predicted AlkP superfamily pyrophosphatase or phosphodiesterase